MKYSWWISLLRKSTELSCSTQFSIIYLYNLIFAVDTWMFTTKPAGNICLDHTTKIQQRMTSGSSPLQKGIFPIISIEWLEGVRSPDISGAVNNLKTISAVNDVINWQFLGITKQHQLRVSRISFNLLILLTTKPLHGWTIILKTCDCQSHCCC